MQGKLNAASYVIPPTADAIASSVSTSLSDDFATVNSAIAGINLGATNSAIAALQSDVNAIESMVSDLHDFRGLNPVEPMVADEQQNIITVGDKRIIITSPSATSKAYTRDDV